MATSSARETSKCFLPADAAASPTAGASAASASSKSRTAGSRCEAARLHACAARCHAPPPRGETGAKPAASRLRRDAAPNQQRSAWYDFSAAASAATRTGIGHLAARFRHLKRRNRAGCVDHLAISLCSTTGSCSFRAARAPRAARDCHRSQPEKPQEPRPAEGRSAATAHATKRGAWHHGAQN